MARKPCRKELSGARLLKDYASWIYCTGCEKTVAYLCYVTYDSFDFRFECKCGNCGSVRIAFEELAVVNESNEALVQVKNRLCCPEDQAALLTLVEKNLEDCNYEIVCKACAKKYSGGISPSPTPTETP